MIAVLTGDIVGSQRKPSTEWLRHLNGVLASFGKQPNTWEIYRGDSFQLRLSAEKAIEAALLIKSAIKKLEMLDVRIAIGIGSEVLHAEKVSMSQGEAYNYSGRLLDTLDKTTLAVASNNYEHDELMNLAIDMACHTYDSWSTVEAEIINYMLYNPSSSQKKAGEALGKSQSTINASLKRAKYKDMLRLIAVFKKIYNAHE